MTRSIRLLGGMALLFSFTLVGCDDGTIPPLPEDSGVTPTLDSGQTDAGPPEAMCDNSVRDGDETGIDCGGSCPACDDGSPCIAAEDCQSLVCSRGRCLVPSCMDEVRNGDETGADCGGDCPLCPGGETCTSNDECLSGRCRGGECAASTCEDGRQNGEETDIDCGGSLCPPCGGGLSCTSREDCVSLICADGTCTMPACNDRVQNQDETSVDCGGSICPGCRDGLACDIDADCENDRCLDGGCISCMDRVTNGDETGVDCGGVVCEACADGQGCLVDGDCEGMACESGLCVSCSDRTTNQDETDVDCGGTVCDACRNGLVCSVDSDCISNDCTGGICIGLADTCADAFVLGQGRNVVNWTAFTNDYFTMRLPSCSSGFSAMVDGPDLVMTFDASVDGVVEYDIEKPASERMALVVSSAACGMSVSELHCTEEFAATTISGTFPVTMGTTYTLYFVDLESGAPTLPNPLVVNIREVDGRCRDGVTNNDETDVDCGGTICPDCFAGQMCVVPGDCVSNICMSGVCNAPGCGDGVLNGRETDLDCGGGACMGCAIGQSCMVGGDCDTGVCAGGVCQAPTCTDGVANGLETDIDCGGSSACPRCPDGRRCPNGPSDCVSPLCTLGRCGDVRGHLTFIGHDYFSSDINAKRVLANAVLQAPETGIIDVLVYDEFADISASGEVANCESAIRANIGTRMVRFTRLSDSSMLSTMLTPAIDVLLLPEQERGSATFPTIAAAWETDVGNFLRAGGVVITTNFFDRGWELVNRPTLATVTGTSSVSGNATLAPGASTHPIAMGVAASYPTMSGSTSYTGLAVGGGIMLTTIYTGSTGNPVVADILF
ncbi:MAG: hypothetical protein RLP09_28750 [Sandaracinaceae bacterium]